MDAAVPPIRITDRHIGRDLLWRYISRPVVPGSRGALFIDRDGVLVEETIYLSDPAKVRLIAGAVNLLRAARSLNIPIVVVTNQAGIGKGKFEWHNFIAVENRIESLLTENGIQLDAVFACPFHEDGVSPYNVSDHPWRKPNPGMILEAALLLNLDLRRSLMVGDKVSDVAAAKTAGLPAAVQVLTGHGPAHTEDSQACISPGFHVSIVTDPADVISALDWIVSEADVAGQSQD